jgi:hypothetical protein
MEIILNKKMIIKNNKEYQLIMNKMILIIQLIHLHLLIIKFLKLNKYNSFQILVQFHRLIYYIIRIQHNNHLNKQN